MVTIGAIRVEAIVTIGVCVAGLASLGFLWKRDFIRPGSFKRVPPERMRHFQTLPAAAWMIGAIVVFLSPALVGAIVLALLGRPMTPGSDLKDNAIIQMALAGSGVMVGVAMMLMAHSQEPNAGLRPRWKDIPIGAAAMVVTFPLILTVSVMSSAVYAMVTGEPPSPIAHQTLSQILQERSNPWVLGIVGAAVIGAPIYEEIAFRFFLQSAFLRAIGNRWIAIIATSVLFAAVHSIGGDSAAVPWHALPSLFALGIAMGVAYERTGRPLVPIVMHMLFNALNVVMALSMSSA